MSPAEQYAPGVSDIMERAAGFSGREWVFERIHDWLNNPAGGRFYLLTAEPGAGKTAIAARMVQFSQGLANPPASCPRFQPGFLNAAHFCSANIGSWIDPTAFARSLSLQLARSHPGFASALLRTGERSVNIQVVQNVGTADKVTGVVIENLVLAGLNPQADFNASFTDPLTSALGIDTRPVTILVDALDEALAFKDDVKILTLLASVNKLPANVRFILTSRPDARVRAVFPDAAGFLLSATDHDDANARDVRGFLDERLREHPQRDEVVNEIVARAERNFQYVTFLLKQLAADPALRLTGLPAGLHPLYRESLARVISLDAWRQKYAPIMGLLSVARESLSERQLRAYSRQAERDVSDALLDLGQFIEETGSPAAYRLYHQSVSDFLRERDLKSSAGAVKNQFYLPPGEWNRAIADYYAPDGPATWTRWDPYGLRYTAGHLAHALEGEVGDNRHALVERMVDLITNPRFLSRQLRTVDDLPGLRHDLVKAVRYAARDNDPAGIVSVTRAALALVDFTAAQLRPEPLFERAASGEVERAAQRVALFEVGEEWSAVAVLALAWWGSAANPAAARAVIEKTPPSGGSLDLLRRYAQAAVDGAPPPVSAGVRGILDRNIQQLLAPFSLTEPDPLLEAKASAAVDRLGGRGADPELLQQFSSPPKPFGGTPVLGQQPGDQQPGYLAKDDAPALVAAAARIPGADRYIREYIAIHSNYQYVQYRNGSLWFVLESVLWHPDPAWVREMVRNIVTSALAGAAIDFREALPLTVAALQAAVGKPDVVEGLFLQAMNMAAAVQTDSDSIPRGGDARTQDPWGSHKRRLAAHAEIAGRIQSRSNRARDALVEAGRLLRSFAGFQAPASLALAEAWEIVEPGNQAARTAQLERSLRAAHNIQDPSFCVRMVSRCNAMLKDWWGRPLNDLHSLVHRLFDEPARPEFAALHYVGDTFTHRAPRSVPIPASTIQAASLEELSEVYRVPLEDLRRANPTVGSGVRIPDPGFATWIAGRLSAAVLADEDLFDEDRVELLQLLAAIAAPNATILDRVLARLAIAAHPADPAMLDALAAAAGPARIQSAPGVEANLPA